MTIDVPQSNMFLVLTEVDRYEVQSLCTIWVIMFTSHGMMATHTQTQTHMYTCAITYCRIRFFMPLTSQLHSIHYVLLISYLFTGWYRQILYSFYPYMCVITINRSHSYKLRVWTTQNYSKGESHVA